jgi:hypothetical protein
MVHATSLNQQTVRISASKIAPPAIPSGSNTVMPGISLNALSKYSASGCTGAENAVGGELWLRKAAGKEKQRNTRLNRLSSLS